MLVVVVFVVVTARVVEGVVVVVVCLVVVLVVVVGPTIRICGNKANATRERRIIFLISGLGAEKKE